MPVSQISTLVALCSATLLLATPYVIYPVVLYLVSLTRRRDRPVGDCTADVTFVISAFNESSCIREKLQNSLELQYSGNLEICVISDASTDQTDHIAKSFQSYGVRLFRQSKRRGKSAALTRFLPATKGELIVFTDANAIFERDAVQKLVRHFADPQVGYVVGRQLYRTTDDVNGSAASENTYWNLEVKIKEWESRVGSVVGGDGAIYALRRELFEPLADEDINDFFLPLRAVEQGYRGVFEPDAVCYEDAAAKYAGEFRRKYRIVNRSMNAVLKCPGCLNPFRVGWFAIQLLCHKVLRWLAPLFLVLALISNVVLVARDAGEIYHWTLALQLAGYGLAALFLFPPMRRVRIVSLAFYFLMVNVAAAAGLGLLLSGRTIGVWNPQR